MAGLTSWVSSRLSGITGSTRFEPVVNDTCFHCGLPMPEATRLWVEFDGAQKPVCCIGCQSLYNLVIGNGMIAYYRERERRAGAH